MADNYTMRSAMGARAADRRRSTRAHEQSLRHNVRWHADHSIGRMGNAGLVTTDPQMQWARCKTAQC